MLCLHKIQYNKSGMGPEIAMGLGPRGNVGAKFDPVINQCFFITNAGDCLLRHVEYTKQYLQDRRKACIRVLHLDRVHFFIHF